MNLYVGNLSFDVTERHLEEKFGEFGAVKSVNVVKDRETGRSRGFAFVEMRNREDAEKAIQELDSQDFEGRPLTVNEARPKKERW